MPLFSILFSSIFTLSSKCRGTLLPLLWIGLNGDWKRVIFLSNGIFPTLLNNPLYFWYRLRIVSELLFNLHNSGNVLLLMGSRGCRWAISIPILGRFSFLRIFLSCPEVIKNRVSSAIHPLDCIFTTTFPMMLIVSLVNPQYSSLVFFSTGCFFNCGFLNFNSCRTFCFRKLTGLAESTGIFKLTMASSPSPMLTNFLVSKPLVS